MISHLADVPFFRDELAALHAAEWKYFYADWGAQTALAEFFNHKADSSLPATLVLHEGMELVGSVSVVFGDCPARLDLDPWLASLYVVPRRRGMGHSFELVQAAIELAAAAALSRRGASFAIVERIPLWRFEVCLSISQYMEGVAVLTRAQNLPLGTAPAHCLNQKRNQGRGLFTNDRKAR